VINKLSQLITSGTMVNFPRTGESNNRNERKARQGTA